MMSSEEVLSYKRALATRWHAWGLTRAIVASASFFNSGFDLNHRPPNENDERCTFRHVASSSSNSGALFHCAASCAMLDIRAFANSVQGKRPSSP